MSTDASRTRSHATTSPASSSAPSSSTPPPRSPAGRSCRYSPRSRPASQSGWHQHPGEEVGYILAGTVRMEIEGHATLTLNAGDPS